MESLIVLSKVKKYIKEKAGFSTSASFFEPLNIDIQDALKNAIDHTKNSDRKTVMGRDFNFYIDNKLDILILDLLDRLNLLDLMVSNNSFCNYLYLLTLLD